MQVYIYILELNIKLKLRVLYKKYIFIKMFYIKNIFIKKVLYKKQKNVIYKKMFYIKLYFYKTRNLSCEFCSRRVTSSTIIIYQNVNSNQLTQRSCRQYADVTLIAKQNSRRLIRNSYQFKQ